MRIPTLKKPDLSNVFDKLALPLLHLMYGGIVLSFILPFFHTLLFTDESPAKFQLAAGIWAAQTWFYQFAYQKGRTEKWGLERKLRDSTASLQTTQNINALLLERLHKMPPSLLKEFGLSIRKTQKVNKDSV